MVFLRAILLGVVQGITEFIPISSTGHMIIVEAFVSLTGDRAFNVAFMVIIQLPSILAVVVYFWRDLWPFGKAAEERAHVVRLWQRILVALVPAVILGFLFDDFIEARLFDPRVVIAALTVGGILLVVLERRPGHISISDVAHIGYGRAFAIGLFQCLAMIPGTSRSAATIIGAMLLGSNRKTAAEFSFFLAIPTMLGATTLKIAKNGVSFTGTQWLVLGVGSLVSFIVAYYSVVFLMNYIKSHDFRVFGYYRIVLAAGIFVLLWLGYGAANVHV